MSNYFGGDIAVQESFYEKLDNILTKNYKGREDFVEMSRELSEILGRLITPETVSWRLGLRTAQKDLVLPEPSGKRYVKPLRTKKNTSERYRLTSNGAIHLEDMSRELDRLDESNDYRFILLETLRKPASEYEIAEALSSVNCYGSFGKSEGLLLSNVRKTLRSLLRKGLIVKV